MNQLRQAIAINNEGTRLLKLGHVVEAMLIFQIVVIELKEVKENDLNHRCLPVEAAIARENGVEQPSRFHVAASYDGLLFVHSRPLAFPVDVVVTSPEEMNMQRNTLAVYAVYNFALACHIHGIATGTDGYLQRACHLYHMIVGSLPLSASTTNNIFPSTLLQSLAFNNLAQIYHTWCDYDASLHCMLECMEGFESQANFSGFLGRHEAEQIQLNRMLVELPFAAQAA